MKTTLKQRLALERLRATAKLGFPRYKKTAYLKTGENTTVLFNLRAAGLVSVSHIFLGGVVSSDFAIVEPSDRDTV